MRMNGRVGEKKLLWKFCDGDEKGPDVR